MDINVSLAGQIFLLLLLTSSIVSAATWSVAKKKVDSPRLLTICNAVLGFFPPLNILVLAGLAMLDGRKGCVAATNHRSQNARASGHRLQ